MFDHPASWLHSIGLEPPSSWPWTVGFAAAWLVLMYGFSPVADRLATRLVAKPPTLGIFHALQQSRLKLVLGIIVAWILGGFVEEIVFRGIVLRNIATFAAHFLPSGLAIGAAIVGAALGAAVVHFYQGLRAAIIIAQLSALFGLLFVLSGYNLWAVILCHGFYDTVAFVRFANRSSRYSDLDKATH
jgi:membrane protease YdiL (CAAX protease family)